jgi:putative ABC transport system permease protein
MAWRNIWRNKMRSIIIMLSISVGLFAGIAILALYKGMMVSRVRTVIDSEVGHLQIHNPGFKKDYDPKFVLTNGDELLNSIRLLPVVKAVAPRSVTNGMLATATGSAGVQINGVVPAAEYIVSKLKQKIIEGKEFDATRENEIMIGKKLAKKMKLKIRSKLVLMFTDTSGSIVSGAFRVAAIYQSDTGNAFHEIAVLFKNDEDLTIVGKQLQSKFPGRMVETWNEISPETDLLVKTTDQYSYIILVIIMLALAFGIINTMLMAILERTKEIGMMVALGTNRVKIFLLVFWETVFLTLAGTPIGIFLAWVLIAYYHQQGLDLSGMGEEMMSSFGFGTLVYPEFPAEKLMGITGIVVGTAIFSCLFPALKALGLQPVEALRR